MIYVIKYTFLIFIALLYTFLITIVGIIWMIIYPILWFKLRTFFPFDRKNLNTEWYDTLDDYTFPIFNKDKIQIEGGKYNRYRIYKFSNHYHHIWGLDFLKTNKDGRK